MLPSDPVRGAKILKPRSAQKQQVAAGAEPPPAVITTPPVEVVAPPGVDENFDPPPSPERASQETIKERVRALTSQERADAASEVPRPPLLAPAIPPTYLIRKGGTARYRGQQIKFVEGETFTSETWELDAIDGFLECGIEIEQTA